MEKRLPRVKRHCVYCGREFMACSRRAIYCRDAHRKADKRANEKACKAKLTRTQLAIKRWKTKSEHLTLVTCVNCPLTFFVDGNNHHRLYHNRACKQKAYRERRAARATSPLVEFQLAAK